jgi:3-deoxy-7-phosphoheptulonate synthase
MIVSTLKPVNNKLAESIRRHFFEQGVRVTWLASAQTLLVTGYTPESLNALTTAINETELQWQAIDTQYPHASKRHHAEGYAVDVGPGVSLGGRNKPVMMAGPCAVESEAQLDVVAQTLVQLQVPIMRAGAFKPRTSAYTFQGLGKQGVTLLHDVCRHYGLLSVSELMDVRDIDWFCEQIDIIQVGSRMMSHTPLLKELGKRDKPIVLKRGMSATYHEWLCAAEYIMEQGNSRVILCERGVRSFDNSVRNLADITAIPHMKQMTHLPIIFDPSHATGHASYVPPLARAAIAAGAHGLLVEAHPSPKDALSDGAQSLDLQALKDFSVQINQLSGLLYPEVSVCAPSLE